MAVTYINKKYGQSDVKFPILHRVVYAHTIDGVVAQWQVSYKDYQVNEWLKEYCRHPYYRSPGYLDEKFIEFECDEDAMLFALRWA